VVIDEAAWIPDIDALWMAIVPTISTRREYRLSVVSTPGPRAGPERVKCAASGELDVAKRGRKPGTGRLTSARGAGRAADPKGGDGPPMSDYRHAATRKNNPPAKIAAEGTVPVVPKAQYAYNAHLPPDKGRSTSRCRGTTTCPTDYGLSVSADSVTDPLTALPLKPRTALVFGRHSR
jgi:hypothetical protein